MPVLYRSISIRNCVRALTPLPRIVDLLLSLFQRDALAFCFGEELGLGSSGLFLALRLENIVYTRRLLLL